MVRVERRKKFDYEVEKKPYTIEIILHPNDKFTLWITEKETKIKYIQANIKISEIPLVDLIGYCFDKSDENRKRFDIEIRKFQLDEVNEEKLFRFVISYNLLGIEKTTGFLLKLEGAYGRIVERGNEECLEMIQKPWKGTSYWKLAIIILVSGYILLRFYQLDRRLEEVPKFITGTVAVIDGRIVTSFPQKSFRVENHGVGDLIIHFEKNFFNLPTCVATQRYLGLGNGGSTLDNAVVVSVSEENCRILIGGSSGNKDANRMRYVEFIVAGF